MCFIYFQFTQVVVSQIFNNKYGIGTKLLGLEHCTEGHPVLLAIRSLVVELWEFRVASGQGDWACVGGWQGCWPSRTEICNH